MWFPDFPAIGFFISYIATSLLVLEALRLISTDANKREAERFLDRYIGAAKAAPSPSPSAQQDPRDPPEPRTAAKPAQASAPVEQTTAFTIEDLDEMAISHHHLHHQRRARTPSPTATPRRHVLASPAPVRQSRTRSNTLTSTASSSSSRHSSTSRHSSSSRTKHRADESGRRQGSPGFRRSREAQGLGSALQRLVKGKA